MVYIKQNKIQNHFVIIESQTCQELSYGHCHQVKAILE